METRPILLLLALLASTAGASEIYKWIDDDGVVHYSDQPRDGAERVNLPKANTISAPIHNRTNTAGDESAPAETGPFSYESLTVTSPAAEETLWNIEGVLNVSLAVTPALQPGHQVRVYHNGELQEDVRGLSFQLQEVWRGVHNLQAEILDESGKMMIRSQPNRFYVQQNTVGF
jgi:hypothetical protein